MKKDSPNNSFTNEDRKISKQMISYWTNFIMNGDPNGNNYANWPSLKKNLKNYVVFKNNATQTDTQFTYYENKRQCDFWSTYENYVASNAMTLYENTRIITALIFFIYLIFKK